MLALLLILACTCAPTVVGQPHVEYLIGVERFNKRGYTDYYFCCNLTGDFIQWEYNNEPLRGFHIQDVGSVVVIRRSTYEFTASLLSSQLGPGTNQRRLDSVMVLSFAGDHPSSFGVTCSSNSDFNTIRVDGLRGKATSSNGSNDEVALDHIVSAEIVQNKSKTHIFIGGAQNDQQFYDIQHDSSIAFSEHDVVGQARTDLSQDGNLVNTQGVLIADHPYRRTSLLFITENSDVTVTCYFGTHQAVLTSYELVPTSNEPVASTDSPPTSTQTAPVTYTTTTSGSLPFHTTYKQLSSTSYNEIPDVTVLVVNSNRVPVTVGPSVGALVIIGGVMMAVSVAIMNKKRKKFSIKDTCTSGLAQGTAEAQVIVIRPPSIIVPSQSTESTYDESSSSTELISYRTSRVDAESGQVSLDMERREKADGELALSYKHACQISMEESSSEDSLRVCESSTHQFGHEYGGAVKSFVSLQEPSFNGSHGLLQECWNASASDNVCPVFLPPITDSYLLKNAFSVESQDGPDVPVVVAAGNTLKMVCVHSKYSNDNVAEENIHITDEAHDKACVTDEDKDVHDDVNDVDATDEGKDVHDNVNKADITDEDEDAHDDVSNVNITDEDKNVHNGVGITDEGKDVYDNVYITHDAYITNDAHDHGRIRVIEEDEDAQSDKRATAKVHEAECEEKPYYYSRLRMLQLHQKFIPRIKYSISFSSINIYLLSPCYYEKMCPEVDVEKKVDQTKQITAANMLKAWDDFKPRCASSDGGSMDVIGGVYMACTKRNAFLSLASLNVKQLVYPERRKKTTSLISWKESPDGTGAVNGMQINSFVHCFLPITISGVDLNIFKSITDILRIIRLVFRVIQMLCITLYFQVLLCFYILASEVSRVPRSGGTLHVPVVGTSSWWGRVRLDLLK